MDKQDFIDRGFGVGTRLKAKRWIGTCFVKVTALGRDGFLGVDEDDEEDEWGYDLSWEEYKPPVDYTKLNDISSYPDYACLKCLYFLKKDKVNLIYKTCPCCGGTDLPCVSTKDAGYPVLKVLPWEVE